MTRPDSEPGDARCACRSVLARCLTRVGRDGDLCQQCQVFHGPQPSSESPAA